MGSVNVRWEWLKLVVYVDFAKSVQDIILLTNLVNKFATRVYLIIKMEFVYASLLLDFT